MLDLFGRDFVLLGFAADRSEAAPLIAAAHERRMPLQWVRIDRADIAALYQRRFVLVRPDGHVAWRADHIVSDPMRLIDVVRGAEAPATARKRVG